MSSIGSLIAIPALQSHQLHVRVARQDADELGAHVAGRADDRDADAPLAAVGGDAASGAGEASRAVRRDRSRCVDAHAHGRARPLTGGRLAVRIGGTADMVRMTIHIDAYSCKNRPRTGEQHTDDAARSPYPSRRLGVVVVSAASRPDPPRSTPDPPRSPGDHDAERHPGRSRILAAAGAHDRPARPSVRSRTVGDPARRLVRGWVGPGRVPRPALDRDERRVRPQVLDLRRDLAPDRPDRPARQDRARARVSAALRPDARQHRADPVAARVRRGLVHARLGLRACRGRRCRACSR